MVDPIYNLFSWEDCILFLSLFLNLGIFLDYLDKKHKLKEEIKRTKIEQEKQRRIEKIRKNKMERRIRDWNI